jgi:hypothetical protein
MFSGEHLTMNRDEVRARRALIPLILTAFCLSACGGGGGTSAANPPTPPVALTPEIIATPGEVALTFAANAEFPPTAGIELQLRNFPASYGGLNAKSTVHGVENLSFTVNSTTQASLVVYFRSPLSLAPDTYLDTLTVRACRDQACADIMAIATIHLQFTVIPPVKAHEPTVTPTPSTIVASGSFVSPNSQYSPLVDIPIKLRFANFSVRPFITIRSTTNAIQGAFEVAMDQYGGEYSASLRLPSQLPIGTYHDTVTFTVCLDRACNYPLAAGPVQVSIDYTLTTSGVVAGDVGYQWHMLDTAPTSLAWDKVSQKLLVGVSPPSGTALIAIDPYDRSEAWRLAIDGGVSGIATGDDGLYTYLAVTDGINTEIRKLRMSDHIVVGTIPLAAGDALMELTVAPGRSDVIAVTLYDRKAGSTLRSSVLIYGPTLQETGQYSIVGDTHSFPLTAAWGASDSILYIYDPNTDELREFSVAQGALGTASTEIVDLNQDIPAWDGIHFDAGLLLENHGAIYDVQTHTLRGRIELRTPLTAPNQLPAQWARSVIDSGTGRAYFWYNNNGSITFQVFDLTTLQSLGAVATGSRSTNDLVRWGKDGIAYLSSFDSSFLTLLSGPLIAPP